MRLIFIFMKSSLCERNWNPVDNYCMFTLFYADYWHLWCISFALYPINTITTTTKRRKRKRCVATKLGKQIHTRIKRKQFIQLSSRFPWLEYVVTINIWALHSTQTIMKIEWKKKREESYVLRVGVYATNHSSGDGN